MRSQRAQTTMTKLAPDNETNRRTAGSLLSGGGVVAYPTDTLYGLGAVVTNLPAVERVLVIKGRSAALGLPVLVGSAGQLSRLAVEVPDLAMELAERFWPGGLTLVLRKHPSISDLVTGGATIAVRQPDHPAPLALIRQCGSPITGTSANRSGGAQPVDAQEVLSQLEGEVDMLLDGGRCLGGVPSTILDVSTDPPRVLRAGVIPLGSLQEACPMELAVPSDVAGRSS